jgi:hypothetical protein
MGRWADALAQVNQGGQHQAQVTSGQEQVIIDDLGAAASLPEHANSGALTKRS